MPIGTPSVPYRLPGSQMERWVDIYTRLGVERILFLGSEVNDGIAKRNLLSSIPNLTCGFGVWLVWSGEFLIIYAVLWFILDNVLSPRNPIS